MNNPSKHLMVTCPPPSTFRVWGDDYPIIKTIDETWHLVAHPNGPALARIFDGDSESGLMSTMRHQCDDIPEDIMAKAIDAFMTEAWKSMRSKYYQPDHT